MIISRVHIRRFRKLVDQVLECGPGLNVIYGCNDAGKSTLHLAVSAALYRVKPAEARSYGTWGEEEPGEVLVEFEAEGRSYRLHKDFKSRKVALVGGGETWDHPREVERRIGELLGLPSLSLFRATAHIKQWDLAGIQDEKQEIGTRLARMHLRVEAVERPHVHSLGQEPVREVRPDEARPACEPHLHGRA